MEVVVHRQNNRKIYGVNKTFLADRIAGYVGMKKSTLLHIFYGFKLNDKDYVDFTYNRELNIALYGYRMLGGNITIKNLTVLEHLKPMINSAEKLCINDLDVSRNNTSYILVDGIYTWVDFDIIVSFVGDSEIRNIMLMQIPIEYKIKKMNRKFIKRRFVLYLAEMSTRMGKLCNEYSIYDLVYIIMALIYYIFRSVLCIIYWIFICIICILAFIFDVITCERFYVCNWLNRNIYWFPLIDCINYENPQINNGDRLHRNHNNNGYALNNNIFERNNDIFGRNNNIFP